jgi:hypothetical protein
MANEVEDVKKLLTELRDVAENQAGAEEPDLRPVAEAYDKFNSAWVSRKVMLNEQEENPDSEPEVQDEAQVTEIRRADGKKVPTKDTSAEK